MADYLTLGDNTGSVPAEDCVEDELREREDGRPPGLDSFIIWRRRMGIKVIIKSSVLNMIVRVSKICQLHNSDFHKELLKNQLEVRKYTPKNVAIFSIRL